VATGVQSATGCGTLSEVAGETTLDIDVFMRTAACEGQPRERPRSWKRMPIIQLRE